MKHSGVHELCSAYVTGRVVYVSTNPVISLILNIGGKEDGVVVKTIRTHPWSYVKQIMHDGQPTHYA